MQKWKLEAVNLAIEFEILNNNNHNGHTTVTLA